MARDATCFVGSTDEAVIGPVLRRWRGASPGMGALVMLPESESTAVGRLQSLFRAELPRDGGALASLAEELYLRLQDRVHHMGANAGSETFKPVPCLFDAGHFIQGALSLGEIGSSTEWSYPMFHNATIVGTVWSAS